MYGLLNGLARWVTVVAMGLATFFPDYGLLWLAIRFFNAAPILITIAGLVWVVVLALALPFTLRWFRIVSTSAVSVIVIGGIWLAAELNRNVLTIWPWFMWLVLIVFIAFGWLMVSTPLWRWARGVVATTQTPDHHTT